jgi:hypothetical protein
MIYPEPENKDIVMTCEIPGERIVFNAKESMTMIAIAICSNLIPAEDFNFLLNGPPKQNRRVQTGIKDSVCMSCPFFEVTCDPIIFAASDNLETIYVVPQKIEVTEKVEEPIVFKRLPTSPLGRRKYATLPLGS